MGIYWILAVATSRVPRPFMHTEHLATWSDMQIELTNKDTFDYDSAYISLKTKKGKRFSYSEKVTIKEGETYLLDLSKFTNYKPKKTSRKKYNPEMIEIYHRAQNQAPYRTSVGYYVRKHQ